MKWTKKQLEKRETINKKVVEYVKEEIKKERIPSYRELNKKFNIEHRRINLKELYSHLNIRFLDLPFKRPNDSLELLRNELISFIRNEVSRGHYPSRRYIERTFRIQLAPSLFRSIQDLYNKAGLEYIQKNSQELKSKKAKILTDIALSILPKLNLELIDFTDVHEHGIDIRAKDKNKQLIGVELKAYNKNEPVKSNNIKQLERFLIKEGFSKIILITTTSKFEPNLPNIDNLYIIDYEKLKNLCNQEQLEKLEFIRNESIHQETKEKEQKKQLILSYAKEKIKRDEDITHRDIAKDLHLHPFTYFNSICEIYDGLGMLPPSNKFRIRTLNKNK